MIAPALLLAALLQDGNVFVSKASGFRIRPPEGWTVHDRPEGPRVVSFEHGKGEERTEMNVYDLRSRNPITLRQFRAELVNHLKAAYKEHRFVLEKDPDGPKATYVIQCLTKEGREVELIKWVYARGFRQIYLIDAAYQKERRETVQPLVMHSIGTFELLRSEDPAEFAKQWGALKEVLAKADGKVDFDQTLDLFAAGKRIGSYALRFRNAEADGRTGYAFSVRVNIDLGDGGKSESLAEGFLSSDLSYQKQEVRETTREASGKEFTAKAAARLQGGQMTGTCTINGETLPIQAAAPEGTVLVDGLEVLQHLVAVQGRATYSLRTLSLYDIDPVRTTLRVYERQRATVDGAERWVTFVIVTREKESPMTYYYADDRFILQVKSADKPIEMKAKQ